MGNTPSDGKGGKSTSKSSSTGKSTKNDKHSKAEVKLTPEDFELIQVIGKGSYGKVLLVRYKANSKLYAMKVLKKTELIKRKQVLNTQTERKILEEMDHPFLVTLKFAFQTADKLYMVLDYFSGGELFFHLKKLGRFSEELSRLYAAEILLGLFHLHNANIVYRDLKPENILLDSSGHVRITDFGLAKELSAPGGVLKSLCGTPEYISPEIVKPTGQGYSFEVDLWALGTMIYEFVTGLPPFYSQQINVMYEKILKQPLTWPEKCDFSPEGRSFVEGLLQKDPNQRLGKKGPDEIKNHPWFKTLDWNKVYNKEVTPPYQPDTTNAAKAQNVDHQFSTAPVVDTPMDTSQMRNRVHFPDFTYKGQGQSVAGQPNQQLAIIDKDDWERL